MSIKKLTEFAKTGDKNTDELDLDRGFPSRIYPARQWFNWLFNSLTSKVNEIIDQDYLQKVDVVNDLLSDDSTKALSAAQGKILNEKMFGINQKYKNVTNIRLLNTTYTNTTPKPIFVVISADITNVGSLTLDDEVVRNLYDGGFAYSFLSFTVLPGGEYKLNADIIYSWLEST